MSVQTSVTKNKTKHTNKNLEHNHVEFIKVTFWKYNLDACPQAWN